MDNKQEDNEEWYNAMQDLPIRTADGLFDDIGDYMYSQQIMEAIMSSNIMKTTVMTSLDFLIQGYNRQIMPREIDFESYCFKFAWLPLDVVKHTFQNSTQF